MAELTVNVNGLDRRAERGGCPDGEPAGDRVSVPSAVDGCCCPIFVVGSLRSGASLLTLSLGQHPNIAQMLDTSWLEPFVIGLQQAYAAGTMARSTSQLEISGIEIEDFAEQFGQAIHRIMLESRFDLVDRPGRWLDGTPSNANNVFPLLRLFPQARFIHVLRDVSEVVESLSNEANTSLYKSWGITMSARQAADHWLEAVTACVEAERAFGSETVLRIRRRDLLEDPEQTIRRCLAFLGEPFAAVCLRPFRAWKDETERADAELPASALPRPIPSAIALLSKLLLEEGTPRYVRDELAITRLEIEFSKRVERAGWLAASRSDRDVAGHGSTRTVTAIQAWKRRLPQWSGLGQFIRSRIGNKPTASEGALSLASFPIGEAIEQAGQADSDSGRQPPVVDAAPSDNRSWSAEASSQGSTHGGDDPTGVADVVPAEAVIHPLGPAESDSVATEAAKVPESGWLRVEVEAPDVSGETVVFRWNQSGPNPFQQINTFFFRYEGLDLSAFSSTLLYEVFLGLQLKVFAAYRAPVEVTFPEPLPRSTIEYWRAFHDADLVSIGPVKDAIEYEPWAETGPSPTDRRPYGVFFGGGKDSTLATCLLSELYGPENIVLIQFVGPLRPRAELMDRLERRQDLMMLEPARANLRVATQRVWTDYQAQFLPGGRRARPHLELYTVGSLPVLLHHGVSLCTFSIPRTAYAIRRKPNGDYWFRYARSRPEVLATQSRHYRRVLGADITVTNLNLLLTELMAYRILAERYPKAFDQIVMCTHAEVGERWCYQCKKCAEYALFGLYTGRVDQRFDYDAFFSRSRYMEKVIEYAEGGVELSMLGNAPWQPFLSTDTHFPTFCQVIAKLSPDLVADRLGKEAWNNLMILKGLFGNREFLSVEFLPARAIERLGHDTARRVARLAADHVEIVEQIPGPILVGNEPAEYDFDVLMPTRTECVEHLR